MNHAIKTVELFVHSSHLYAFYPGNLEYVATIGNFVASNV